VIFINKISIKIELENCCDCPHHYIEKIYTPDPFEHEEGCYCAKVEDKNSYNKRHKLVVADDWDIRKWSEIPNWCPLLREIGDI